MPRRNPKVTEGKGSLSGVGWGEKAPIEQVRAAQQTDLERIVPGTAHPTSKTTVRSKRIERHPRRQELELDLVMALMQHKSYRGLDKKWKIPHSTLQRYARFTLLPRLHALMRVANADNERIADLSKSVMSRCDEVFDHAMSAADACYEEGKYLDQERFLARACEVIKMQANLLGELKPAEEAGASKQDIKLFNIIALPKVGEAAQQGEGLLLDMGAANGR